jgi:type I restriction enzyme, S subunit
VESRLPAVAWPKVRLAAVAAIHTGVAKGSKKPIHPVELPYLRGANVQAGSLDLAIIKRIEIDRADVERYSLRRGDVLMTEGGDFDKLGRGAIWTGEIEPCLHQNHVFAVRCDRSMVLPEWVSWVSSSHYGRRYFLLCSKQSTNLASINSSQLKAFPLPLPSLTQQESMAKVVHAVEKKSEVLSTLIDAKRTYKRGLMQQLLSGQRRFPIFRSGVWKTAALGDVIAFKPRKVPKPAGSFLSAGVRSHGKGVFLKEEFPSDQIALDELFQLKHGDLVVNITFGWEGAVAIVPWEADGALVSHRFPTYEIDQSKVCVEYLRHVVRMKRFIFDVAIASPGGAGRNRVLNRSEFLAIGIPLPSIAEQEMIASTLNACDREIDLLVQLHQQVGLQKRVILSRFLSGELSVPSA